MGSSASKASRVVGAATRQYPTRTPPISQTPSSAQPRPPPNQSPGPTVRPPPQASGSRSEAINLDASDPEFARSLRSLGPVQPNPTMSNTSAFSTDPNQPQHRQGPDPRSNPAIAVLDARAKLQDDAEREFLEAGRRGHEGRQFLHVFTIRQMLILRDHRGKSAAEIEKALRLKTGVVDRLGPRGVVELVQEAGRAQKGVDII